MRDKRNRGISRIDQPEKHNHGWYVRVRRKGKVYAKLFSDGKHGGRGKALTAARKYRDQLLKQHPPLSRKELASIPRRKTGSGVVGVRRVVRSMNKRKSYFWQASWSPRRNVRRKKLFSCDKYGPDRAKQLAVRTRREGLREMIE